jgi:hypothetical protein
MTKVTPKQAARLVRQFNAGMNDPMTQAMHAGEFVSTAFEHKCHRRGLSIEDVHATAEIYFQQRQLKRTKYKNPARLKWKRERSEQRCYAAQQGPF